MSRKRYLNPPTTKSKRQHDDLEEKIRKLDDDSRAANSRENLETILEQAFLTKADVNKSRNQNKLALLEKIQAVIDHTISAVNNFYYNNLPNQSSYSGSNNTTLSTNDRRLRTTIQQLRSTINDNNNSDINNPIVMNNVNNHENVALNTNNSVSTTDMDWQSVKLLEPFKGTFQDFPKFIATFEDVVHNTTAKTSKKWMILVKLLDPKSLDLIAGTTKNEYNKALQILKEHYQNPNAVREFHTKRIRDLKCVVFESDIDQLRINVSIIKDSFNCLVIDPANAGFLDYQFLLEVANKLPLSFIRQATITNQSTRLTAKGLMMFLNTRMIQLENERSLTQNKEPEYRIKSEQPVNVVQTPYFSRYNQRFWQNNSVPRYSPYSNQQTEQRSHQNFENRQFNNRLTFPKQNQKYLGNSGMNQQQLRLQPINVGSQCLFCKGKHSSYLCNEKTYFQKMMLLRGRCKICFDTTHPISACPKKLQLACKQCRGLHHVSICWSNPQVLANEERINSKQVNHYEIINPSYEPQFAGHQVNEYEPIISHVEDYQS